MKGTSDDAVVREAELVHRAAAHLDAPAAAASLHLSPTPPTPHHDDLRHSDELCSQPLLQPLQCQQPPQHTQSLSDTGQPAQPPALSSAGQGCRPDPSTLSTLMQAETQPVELYDELRGASPGWALGEAHLSAIPQQACAPLLSAPPEVSAAAAVASAAAQEPTFTLSDGRAPTDHTAMHAPLAESVEQPASDGRAGAEAGPAATMAVQPQNACKKPRNMLDLLDRQPVAAQAHLHAPTAVASAWAPAETAPLPCPAANGGPVAKRPPSLFHAMLNKNRS